MKYLIYNPIDKNYLPQTDYESAVMYTQHLARKYPGSKFSIYQLIDRGEGYIKWDSEVEEIKQKDDCIVPYNWKSQIPWSDFDCNYVARNEDGEWHQFFHHPVLTYIGWLPAGLNKGESIDSIMPDGPSNWKESLAIRPKER